MLTPEQIYGIVLFIDSDGDGLISFDDFKRAFSGAQVEETDRDSMDVSAVESDCDPTLPSRVAVVCVVFVYRPGVTGAYAVRRLVHPSQTDQGAERGF
jgi:hypothetical protein